ncbi:testis-expressed protein 47-like isoform X2 [Chelonia mydas]|uniref:testis-expressed protein 47-like isoform X2 n=1 Tax=Chelonia mydas TaxID=8469 RepID=UPI001CA877A7|nr:testis-expressed protein 47-like isoform X2 [Chelonia mydas]
MASRPKRAPSIQSELEEFAFKARLSVYGLAQEQQKAIRKKLLLHRLVFLAKISPELADKQDLAGYWHRLFLSLQRYYQGEGVTGLLLLYPTYLVHTLEASSEVLYSILRDLRDMQPQQHRALVLEPKILALSHNIPSRLFQQWSHKVLDVPSRHLGYTTLREEPIETIIGECLAMLLKLGMHLLKYPQSSPNLPNAVLEKVPNLIISQDTICHLLECQELLSPAQFLQIYDSPLNVVMDSECVWPLPGKVKLDAVSSLMERNWGPWTCGAQLRWEGCEQQPRHCCGPQLVMQCSGVADLGPQSWETSKSSMGEWPEEPAYHQWNYGLRWTNGFNCNYMGINWPLITCLGYMYSTH